MRFILSILVVLSLTALLLFFGSDSHVSSARVSAPAVKPSDTLKEITNSATPTEVGEKLSYVASWSNFVAAGRLSMETQEASDKSNLRFIADFNPIGLVKSLYNVSHHYDSTVERTTLLPNQFIARTKEQTRSGPEEKESEVKFDQSKHVAKVDNKSITIAPQTYDYVSLLYAMRKLDLKDGKTYTLMGFDGKNNFTTEIEVLGRESVNVGEDSRKAIKVALRYGKAKEKPSDEYEVRIWFSDDVAHVPLVITANPPFGLVKAELRSATTNAKSAPSAPSEDKLKPQNESSG